MARNKICDIHVLRYLNALIQLDLNLNNVVDLFPLSKLKYLESVELSENPIVHIHGLKELKYLQWLNLSKTFVLDLTPIEEHANRWSSQYNIEELQEPTTDQINYSLIHVYIHQIEKIKQLFHYQSKLCKQSIKNFKKQITKPYKAAGKTQQKFMLKITNVFEQFRNDIDQ
ncbi:Conserved_hypothetical protein [Hexamita inflata]|uniref:Uncharacterized protein n=1 Tax=Hexamita inflata TaxID=28002 RepID=A0AA86QBR4_9EUKA|nr:Conserved hypothetical protein [Hexamita inflata]